jgi:hypothetical protein
LKNSLRSKIETVVSGLVYVAIGTALATQVSAQNSAAKKASSKLHTSTKPTATLAPPADTCETSKSSDAMCTGSAQQARDSDLSKKTKAKNIKSSSAL